MNLIKKTAISSVLATAIFVIALFAFRVIAIYFARQYGIVAENAFNYGFDRFFSMFIILSCICMIVYIVTGFAKEKLAKILGLLFSILFCVVCFIVCKQIAQSSGFYSLEAEIRLMAMQSTKMQMFTFGFSFPILYVILYVQSWGESVIENLINQTIISVSYLILFFVLSYMIQIVDSSVYLSVVIASCLSSVILIVPAFNMDRIKKSIKK